MSSSKKPPVASIVFGVVGAVGAIFQLADYTFAFLISGAAEAEPYYNPFNAQALFLLAGLIVGAVLGLVGGIISRKNGKAGGRILFGAAGLGLVTPVPYYTYQGFLSTFFLSLYYPPWWTMLLLAGGLFARQSRATAQPGNPEITSREP